MAGAKDEAVDPDALRTLFQSSAPQARVTIVPEVSHLGLPGDPGTLSAIAAWLQTLPDADAPR
jgi:hypothetical protein